MLEATHSSHAPWWVVHNNDKKRGRLGIIRTVLRGLDYAGKDETLIGAIDSRIVVAPEDFLKSHAAL